MAKLQRGRPPAPHNLHGRLLLGDEEPIFRAVPADVLANLRHEGSENALLWNLIYPLAQPAIALSEFLAVKPVWGTVVAPEEDDLLPYFWGYSVAGELLPGLQESLLAVNGPTAQTEIDLILLGRRHLIVAEVKNRGFPGRCVRHAAGRCPEAAGHGAEPDERCRYWHGGESGFEQVLDVGTPLADDEESPACAVHYQLARTLLIGAALARRLDRQLHAWLILPRSRWREHELGWLDFTARVRDPALWRRLRVLAWEDVQRLSRPRPGRP